MSKLFYFLIIVCWTTPSIAQQEVADYYNFAKTIDSLNQVIDAEFNPEVKANKLIELSFYYTDLEEALTTLQRALQIAHQIRDTSLATEVGINMASFYFFMGDYNQSALLYDSLMPHYKTITDEETFYKTEFQHAKLLSGAGRYYDALETGLEAYEYFSNKEGEEAYSGLVSSVIASIYNKLERKKEAIRQFEISLDWCQKSVHPNCISSTLLRLAELHLKEGEIDAAWNFVIQSEETIKDHPNLQWKRPLIDLTKVKVYLAMEKPNEAIATLNSALHPMEKLNLPVDLAWLHHYYAQAYIANNQYYKALEHNNTTLEIGNKSEHRTLTQNAHYTNSIIFEKLGQSKKALESLRNSNAIREAILSKEKIAQINDLDGKYKAAVQQTKISNLEKENALNELTIQRSKQRKFIWIGSIVILFVGSLILFYYLRRKSRTNALLEEKNAIISKSLQDKDILLREIHHRVKNNLQVVSSLLNLQANYISDDAALEAITEGKNRVSSMALIHQNLYGEQNLTSINCQAYFNDLIENLFDSYNIDEDRIGLSKNIADLDIDVDTMIPLGLIVNELVTNALKHAFKEKNKGGVIEVTLDETNNVLRLTIADNGIGITENQFWNSDSFGNKMIKAFKQKLNADITVRNRQGTEVCMTIKNYKIAAA